MLNCTRYETGKVQSGEAVSITRLYPSGCPHEVGARIVLTSRFISDPGEGEVPFAVATITSIRPTTVKEMASTDRLAQMDGFPNADAWHRHFGILYPGIDQDNARLFRLQLKYEEMEKGVSERTSRGVQKEEV